ncbi:YbaN family protein [Hydrogenophaga sp. A37]|uniref:YbaN family protein n=1 Tax=Hydrogenophaga sp. A37 TaxID=1945864 RepID=UPI0009855F05|nr:YbaN family protein [Hydrogenophaga sp. A37]
MSEAPRRSLAGPLNPPSKAPTPHRSRLVRGLLWVAGSVALLLGIVGVVLPGLPTTPFVLLAAACYAKASPRLHTWLLNHRLTGPMLRDWESDRSLTRRSKAIAVGSMLLMVSVSIWHFQGRVAVQLVLLVTAAIGAGVMLRIPTRKPK